MTSLTSTRRLFLAGAASCFYSTEGFAAPLYVANVRDAGARGDGISDDSRPVQAAIDEAVRHKGTVIFPYTQNGYRIGRIEIRDSVTIDLGTSRLRLFGPRAGFHLVSSVSNFSILNGEIWGDGTLENDHHAVRTTAVTDHTSIYPGFSASDLVVANVVNGFRVDGIRDASFRRVSVRNTVGNLSGTGYGIAFGKGDVGDCENVLVEDCHFDRTTRHAVYVAGARHVVLRRLACIDHAPQATRSHYRSAIAIARSQHVSAHGLTFLNCKEECIGIDDDQAGYTTSDILISNVAVVDAADIVLRITTEAPWQEGSVSVERVTVSNMDVSWTRQPRSHPIVIGDAADVSLLNIHLDGVGPPLGELVWFSPTGEHRTGIVIDGVEANLQGKGPLFWIPASLHRGAGSLLIRNVQVTGAVPIVFAGHDVPTNSNMRIDIDNWAIDVSGKRPSVAGAMSFRLSQSEDTTLEDFENGFPGQTIEVSFSDDRTILCSSRIMLLGGMCGRADRGAKTFFRRTASGWQEVVGP